MTNVHYFTIRRAFLIPLGLLLILCLLLLGISLAHGEPVAKAIILGFIILPILVLFVESATRRIHIDERGVTVRKFLRQQAFAFDELTAIDTVMVRKRVFLTLSAGEDFLILSNAYANFPALVRTLLERVPPGAISEETETMAVAPPVKSTDVFSCWLAVALLAFILYIQLGGSF